MHVLGSRSRRRRRRCCSAGHQFTRRLPRWMWPFSERWTKTSGHGARVAVVEREALAPPVARGAESLELPEDAAAVLVLPLPDAARRIPRGRGHGVVRPSFADLLDHGLRGDAGVVGARHPEGVVALHAVPADEHVLDGVVERVAHVQRAGDVRRRDDDGVRRFAPGRARRGTGARRASASSSAPRRRPARSALSAAGTRCACWGRSWASVSIRTGPQGRLRCLRH